MPMSLRIPVQKENMIKKVAAKEKKTKTFMNTWRKEAEKFE